MRVTVRVPATSANLGPGFDTFGLALDLCNEVTLDTDARPGVSWQGEGADELPVDGSDVVSTTMASVAESVGVARGVFGDAASAARAARREPHPDRARARVVFCGDGGGRRPRLPGAGPRYRRG